MFLKGWILTVWTKPQCRGSAVIIFATMFLHASFPLIWYATWSYSEQVEFWTLIPPPRVGGRGVCGKIFAIKLLHLLFAIIWCVTWPWSEKIEFFTFWPMVEGGCGRNICYHVVAFVIPLYSMCNMTMFWKVKFWPFDPTHRVVGLVFLIKNIRNYVAACVIPFNLLCNMTIYWTSWTLSMTPPPGFGGSVGHIFYFLFVIMLPHAPFPLIWYATRPYFEKVGFWPYDPTPGSGDLWAKHLLPFGCIHDSI